MVSRLVRCSGGSSAMSSSFHPILVRKVLRCVLMESGVVIVVLIGDIVMVVVGRGDGSNNEDS